MQQTELGREVREARVKAGLTLRALAKRCKFAVRTIHAIEIGDSKKPDEDKLRILADELAPHTSYERLVLATYNAAGQTKAAPARAS